MLHIKRCAGSPNKLVYLWWTYEIYKNNINTINYIIYILFFYSASECQASPSPMEKPHLFWNEL